MATHRIQSLDVLRGLVMVIMALDHVRDYFYLDGFHSDPTDLETTYPLLFMTRFVTHFCAPTFVFLAGTSAFLYGRNKSKKELSVFLSTRGLWLIFVDLAIMSFLWFFDIRYRVIVAQVIWVIGLSMIFLSVLIYIPKKVLATLALILVFGHNALDGITREGTDFFSILWYIFHQQGFVPISDSHTIMFFYPALPWIATMALGYVFGGLFTKEFSPDLRKKRLLQIGLSAFALFLVLRGINVYGDMNPWSQQRDLTFTFLSFLKVTKYPPSLLYLLVTLGPTIALLAFLENFRGKVADFLIAFGRVPFFFYIVHILFIHLLALIVHVAMGGEAEMLVITIETLTTDKMVGYGYPLWVTYVLWVLVVFALYFPCRWYMNYKANHRDNKWLTYL